MNTLNLVSLEKDEQLKINGGIICGGVCMFALGVAVGMMIMTPALVAAQGRR